MSSLGIYFGPRAISIVETKGRKLINNIQISQSTVFAGELEEKVPGEVKIIGIIALFKEELRKNKIEAKEATLCLSGKDLIIRTFEIPLLPREEIQGAINFEVKKYIPFKVEELISDFQLKFDKITRTNTVLFMGIKKETLEKYISILNQLNIKINAIEYSAFSVLRCLKLGGLSDSGVVGVLGADLAGKDEVNFTVLENGFPLFSCDITLLNGPEQVGKSEEIEPNAILEKLKREIGVSLDYYHRKFPGKNIKKIYFLFNQDRFSELEAFMMDIGLPAKFIDVNRCIDRTVPYSLSFIKGYTASLSKIVKNNLTVNLLAAKEKAKSLKEKEVGKEAISLLQGLRLDYRFATLGLLICIATFGFGLYRIQSLRKELNRIVSMRPQVSTLNPGATYEELNSIDSEYKRKLGAIDNLIKRQIYLTELLDILPRALPKGVWLTNLSFKKEEGGAQVNFEGMVYLADSDKEFTTLNQFLADLKGNPEFSKYFKEANITSLDRKQVGNLTMLNFLISCRIYR